ncbi:MAG: N-acetylmuramoyl-L-alanine amidase [Candidatus Moranbacteria bacterium]|nr:N-acetylmuramoyl-L-alanine amidase [Candidatus Moranbacteria bacterium]
MGLFGIIITVAVMALGTGYLLIGSSGSSVSVENPATISQQPADNSQQSIGDKEQGTTENRLSVGMEALEKAKEAKDLVEQKATETMEQGTGSKEQGADNGQQDSKSVIPDPQSEIAVKDRLVSFGYAESPGRTIDTVVLHSSYNNQGGDRYSVDKVIDIWKSYEVAPHYMIDRKGNILRLVEDQDIAYHAGNSKMPDGRTNVNGFSIGIEILNAEDDEYATVQYEAVNDLVAYLKREHGVKYVVGHDDIAPGRKTDPWNFDWKKLK